MASPAANKGIEIKVAPEALMAIMGTSSFSGMGQGSSGRSFSGGGSGEYWKGDPGMDDATLGAALQGSSGRAETGGFPGSKQQPTSSSMSRSGSPATPRKTLVGG